MLGITSSKRTRKKTLKCRVQVRKGLGGGRRTRNELGEDGQDLRV
jgi:hypothetical protein